MQEEALGLIETRGFVAMVTEWGAILVGFYVVIAASFWWGA